MTNKELAQKIKKLRVRKGFSQEELSERSGLSLRTIQRIENGETEPRGDSLRRIAFALDVTSDEITDWTLQDDKGFLMILNLSALSFIISPVLGILIPLIIWISKKDKIRHANDIATELLNFQITWVIFLFFMIYGVIFGSIFFKIRLPNIANTALLYLIFKGLMYSYNFVLIIINTFRINNEKKVRYLPSIRFIRK